MEEIAGRNGWLLLCLVSAVGTYIITFVKHHSWPFYVLGAMFAVGVIGLAIGRRQMPEHPVRAVKLIQVCLLATLSFTTLILMLGFALEAWGRHYFEFMDKADQETLSGALLVTITAAIAFFVVNKFNEEVSRIFPSGQTRAAFVKEFSGKVPVGGNPEYDAMHDKRVNANPPIEGWGLCARIRRAELLAKLVKPAPPPPGATPGAAAAQEQQTQQVVDPPADAAN